MNGSFEAQHTYRMYQQHWHVYTIVSSQKGGVWGCDMHSARQLAWHLQNVLIAFSMINPPSMQTIMHQCSGEQLKVSNQINQVLWSLISLLKEMADRGSI